jgi:hypothetical protein
MRAINFEMYPRKKGIHDFQASLIVQEHGDDKNPRDELLLTNLRISSPKFVHSR